ncbi:hypothetical protein G15_0237 [Enterococcus avium]|nr:hypothetical protein G15_0237 [Enterococcus avium]
MAAGVFTFQSSRIMPAQPVVDEGNDQPHKEWREDISYELTQVFITSSPINLEGDDVSGYLRAVR